MANVVRKIIYRCSDDCEMSGCPSHEGVLNYQSVSDAYEFIMNGEEYFFERGELEAMIDLLKSINRADCIQINPNPKP